MEHRILASYVKEFSQSSQIENLAEHKQFEYFSNYTLMSGIHPEAFSEISNLSDVDVDLSGTFGIDAIAIFVNGNLVQTTDDIDSLAKSNYIDAKIMFVQSKISKSIDIGDSLKFIEAVKYFLSLVENYDDSNPLSRPKALLEYLLSSKIARILSSDSPKCQLMFCYGGNEPVSDFIKEKSKNRCNELKRSIPEFKDVDVEFWHADKLIEAFKQVENQFEVEIRFKNNLPLDSIDKVEQAYIGYIGASEFLKLIVDPAGSLRRNVFYDNVRDFQGIDNTVNSEIATTIINESSIDKFVLFNNGITAVASYLKNLGSNRFLLRNYQIVNGCQTSNVLYLNRAANRIEEIQIPIKIVHTNDTEVVGQIIRANNRQTPVPTEAFVALETWHKKLQEYFSLESKRHGEVLFYERRSKEFTLLNSAPDKKRVVGLHSLTRSFTATFSQKPHMVLANNTNEILRVRADHLFQKDHKYHSYLASAMLLFKIHEALNQKSQNSFSHRHRYHIAMLYCCIIGKSTKPPLPDTKKSEDLAEEMLKTCTNTAKFEAMVSEISDFIKRSRDIFVRENGYNQRNPPLRNADFTEHLLTGIWEARFLQKQK